jgi:hypothetical protein
MGKINWANYGNQIKNYGSKGVSSVAGKVCFTYIKQVKDRDNTISQKNATISNLNSQIKTLTDFKNKCIAANNRLINKNNALLDTTQYYNDQIFGNTSTTGYIQNIAECKIKNDETLNQRLGEIANQKEGFSMFNKIDDENNVIQNQITVNKNEHSVDNQKYTNLNNRIEFLNKMNEILGWVLFGIIVICAVVIWGSNEDLKHKLIMIKVVWLYLIFVEILEYVFFYVYRYLNALLFGEPYNANDFWKFPKLTWIDIGIIILIALSVFI